jgi:hypothetical protein
MRAFLTVLARILASISTFFFVVTTILAIFLTSLNLKVFDAALYKNALVQQNIYTRLPEIIGVALTSSSLRNPCTQNPLACSMDGASPELQTCLTTALGQAAYQAIGSGQRNPSDAEVKLAQPCLDQFGSPQTSNPQSGSGGPGGMPAFFQNLSAANWQSLVTIVLPPDELKAMTESTLDQLFAFLNGETNTVAIPLDKLKERLAGTSGANLFMQLLNSQPPCTMQDVLQMLSGTSNGGMVLCNPPKIIQPTLTAILPDLLNLAVPQIPDQVIIIKPPAAGSPNPGSGPFGTDPINTIRIIRWIMRLSFLFPLAFLLLITVFAVRSIKSWMLWWGIPFFVSGTISLVLAILAVPVLSAAWLVFIVPRIPPVIPANITGIGLDILRTIILAISKGIILWAILLLAIGLAAWIGSYFFKIRNGQNKPAVTSPPDSIS